MRSPTSLTVRGVKPLLTTLPLLLAPLFPLAADEGMWLFNQPPRAQLKERYQFDATDAWLEHLQKSSVRFNSGGSGSFLSEDGLLISNHHVGADALQKISTKEKNYLRNGFSAKSLADEVKCLDLELNVLQSIEDVTAQAVDIEARLRALRTAETELLGMLKDTRARGGKAPDVLSIYRELVGIRRALFADSPRSL